MANLGNLTPFAIRDFHGLDKEGVEVLTIVVTGRFHLPGRHGSRPDALRVCDEQVRAHAADVYWGEPGQSSLRYEVQNAYTRPGTDIYLSGHARAPRGRVVPEVLVRLQVGTLLKEVVVIGDRQWRGGILSLTATTPKPFEAMPLVYERAFGGNLPADNKRPAAWEPRNPVGCGLYRDALEAADGPLPNLEDPRKRITRWSDRPAPAGFGPVSRSWQPRLPLAGTYDEKWVENRAPLWPEDMDERFFHAASPGLVATLRLSGGESVMVEGVSPEGAIRFEVPRRRLHLKTVFRHRSERRMMVLDGLLIEPDDGTVTLIWRATVSMHQAMHYHRFSVVRELEDWEGEPG